MYNKKAFEILTSSINSAVFIDEKAKDFYSNTPVNEDIPEESLSINLYNTFKENGKSLTVHKFQKTDLENDMILDYLFNDRDLILLDWELDAYAGQEHSLSLLSKAIELPYINFCCIYSRSTNFNQIPDFLTAFFSGLNDSEIEQIVNTYSHIEVKELNAIRNASDDEVIKFFEENEIKKDEFPIDRYRLQENKNVLDIIYICLDKDNFMFPSSPLEPHDIIFSTSNSFIINNTLVFLLKKEAEIDGDFPKLIQRISDEVIKNKTSFFQLLGIEMQAIFNTNEKFIDNTILKSSAEALFSFRNHLKDDKAFGIIIKKLLLEQATLNLRTAKFKLLESDFLDDYVSTLKEEATTEDLLQLNTFYNSVSVKSLNDKDIPNLNFGDIFKDDEGNYYLCVTALCDCYYPKKFDYNFYFVKGELFDDVELALTLGDTAFLSFIPENKAIYWGNLEDPKIKRIKNVSLSNSDDDPKKLKNDIKTLEQVISKISLNQSKLTSFLYKPFYIRPKVYNVQDNKLIDNKIRIWDITNKTKEGKLDQNLNYFEVNYVVTLRNDYTQRIANHAFGHPGRVGVDFVKK